MTTSQSRETPAQISVV